MCRVTNVQNVLTGVENTCKTNLIVQGLPTSEIVLCCSQSVMVIFSISCTQCKDAATLKQNHFFFFKPQFLAKSKLYLMSFNHSCTLLCSALLVGSRILSSG